MKTTQDFKFKFLGIIPHFKVGKVTLSPQEVAAFSGLLTFRGDSVAALVKEAKQKKQKIPEKVKFILRKSALRGHASMATMPVFCFSFEASKMIGSMITGITFSSALMHSGRRAKVTLKENVVPTSIVKNKRALKLYEAAAALNINVFNELLEMGAVRDEAGKILHYGTYGTGTIVLPAESLATFLQEYEMEKEWMPEEAHLLIQAAEKGMKKWGIDLLYSTRAVAPKNTYPYPNLFKDPKRSNLVRGLIEAGKLGSEENKILMVESVLERSFKERVKELRKKQLELWNDLGKLKKNWRELLNLRRALVRDYGNGLSVRSLSKVSWRIWRDKKRHRTAPVVTDSIYYWIEAAAKEFKKYEKEFTRTGDLGEKVVLALDQFLAVPPVIRKKEGERRLYLAAAFASLKAYKDLVKMGIPERDAVFIIPRALRIAMLQEYNLFNLIDGYYPLRSCPTADEQVFRQTRGEIKDIKGALRKKGLGDLADLIEPKCTTAGFCPEEESCGYFKSCARGYDKEFHALMKDELEKDFQKKLKSLGS